MLTTFSTKSEALDLCFLKFQTRVPGILGPFKLMLLDLTHTTQCSAVLMIPWL